VFAYALGYLLNAQMAAAPLMMCMTSAAIAVAKLN
jgi:hypothetical protein